MISAIKDIYESEDLVPDFEFLCTPLKSYNNFFSNEIENSSGSKKVALHVMHVASAFFAYPALGLLACAGICIKMIGIPSLTKHNKGEKASVEFTRTQVSRAELYATDSASTRYEHGREMQVVKEIKITKQNVDTMCDSMNQEIDTFTKRYKRVFISTNGIIREGNGEITMQLRTFTYIGKNVILV